MKVSKAGLAKSEQHLSDSSFAQEPLLAKDVIFTFEDTYQTPHHCTQTYFSILNLYIA